TFEVFTRGLYILLPLGLYIAFKYLGIGAWFKLIRYAYRYYIQLFQCGTNLPVTNRKHLYQGCLGTIIPILGAAIPLCNPYRLPLLYDGIANICRMKQGILILLNTGTTPEKGKHLVDPTDIYNKLTRHQIASKGNLGSPVTILQQNPLHYCRVKDNISVI